MARLIKNATYGTDRGTSSQLPYKNESGEEVLAPRRWTVQWIQSLSQKDLYSLVESFDKDDDYWSIQNFRTLGNRRMMLYHECERRMRERRKPVRALAAADAGKEGKE